MPLLLDTHVFLWWILSAPRLKGGAQEIISNPDNLVFVSAASAWETAIKVALGKFDMPINEFRQAIVKSAFSELPISITDALAAGALPLHHRDPFDRMLVAQAQANNLTLITHDKALEPYDVPILWT